MSVVKSLCLKRASSSISMKKPPFYTVFPQKKLVNRILFELDSKLTLPKLYPVYESIYCSLGKNEPEFLIPTSFRASDVMIMKKVLEKLRHRTKSVNRNLVDLENELLEKAAEMGDSDAIAVLSFKVLKAPDKNSSEDITHAKKLIKELYQLRHALTIKLTGDFAFKNMDFDNAGIYYNQFLAIERDTYRAGEVYGKLGIISFKKPNLIEAERCLLASIRLCPLESIVQSYYHLAQIYMDSEPLKARALMESAASEGFKESFRLLGFLEMNYFKNYNKSLEWFKLGMELYDVECFIGYFDCCVKLQAWRKAGNCLKSMQNLSRASMSAETAVQSFLSSRKAHIQKLETYSNAVVSPHKLADVASVKDGELQRENRWKL
ncbi:LANO_0G09010g1_1 [Lachancea nothofagi CBS 11611]|uniref:LANO_0G09010g1_1 n=1 Tax=Lachancea nothofagi CBS 11611 TaxID=1266666 RepID=A0A1G4KIF0_9SACH|nr:LANO_0G09010g1_1 [Lachancea nothofagi CBS 11611]